MNEKNGKSEVEDTGDRLNVMNIAVDDDFNVDDIWYNSSINTF